jgi:hypothetical protein
MSAERLIGVLLIGFGVLLFLLLQVGVGAEAIPLLIGLGFLTAYGATRNYGLLVPGCILAGLGTGIVVASAGGPGAAPVLGLGLGFLTIAFIDGLVRRRTGWLWWPLIPGGILTLVGLTSVPETRTAFRIVVPAVLVVVGLWLIIGYRRRAPGHVAAAGAPGAAAPEVPAAPTAPEIVDVAPPAPAAGAPSGRAVVEAGAPPAERPG